MATYPVRTRRWTRAEYERLIDVGVFQPDEPVELLGGELVDGEPQKSEHRTAIGLVEDALRASLRPGWLARSQGPIEYARARLEDYWILNLVDRVLEVYRRPVADAAAPFGWRYASREVRGPDPYVEPLAAPETRIRVTDLLP